MATRGKHPKASAEDLREIRSGKGSARDRAEAGRRRSKRTRRKRHR